MVRPYPTDSTRGAQMSIRRGAGCAQREQALDAILQNLDAPTVALDLGGDHALADDGLKFFVCARKHLHFRTNGTVCAGGWSRWSPS